MRESLRERETARERARVRERARARAREREREKERERERERESERERERERVRERARARARARERERGGRVVASGRDVGRVGGRRPDSLGRHWHVLFVPGSRAFLISPTHPLFGGRDLVATATSAGEDER